VIVTLGTTPALARSMIFERVELDAVNRAREVRVAAAGKSVNVARVSHTLGEPVRCTGFIGGDSGVTLKCDLDALGITHAFVETASPTRVCVTVIERGPARATELIEEPGPVTPGEADALLLAVRGLASIATTLVCSGTLAPGLPGDFYRVCIRAARDVNRSIRCIVDARGIALRHAAEAGAIIKCNRAELGDCVGEPVDTDPQLDHAIASVLVMGAVAAVITDGTRPTHVADAHTRATINTPTVPVVSPIGSGDALAGGLAAGLERGLKLLDAARLGVACGAANAQTPIAGQVDPVEVNRLHQTLRREPQMDADQRE
jgi:tagatose 6-phosphate kinase